LGVSSPRPSLRHREPSQGWTTEVPSGWRSVAGGPVFVRGNPWADPARLIVESQPGLSADAALRGFAAARFIRVAAPGPGHDGARVRWARHAGETDDERALPVALAVAEDGAGAVVVALVAPPGELDGLVDAALLPALDAFAPGPPDPPRSILATPVADASYWPTSGWRSATPEDHGMDGARLDAMMTEIHARELPIDSVTVVRHGHVVLDATLGPFAEGGLRAPFASGSLHELQSVTKSVISMVLGIALAAQPAGGATVDTPVLDLIDARHVPSVRDPRMRAMTLRDLLTMRSGLAWAESGRPYLPGTGNDVLAMIETADWTRFVLDRPMAAARGARFNYDTGAAHLVSAAISGLVGRPADELAAEALFAPLGITDVLWKRAPEGVSVGGFGLLLEPRDLAKVALLALHGGRWEDRQVVPAEWLESSTTDHVGRPPHQYGHFWWMDRADGYAHMAGLYGQLAAIVPARGLVAVITAHMPGEVDSSAVNRWLLEEYVLPAAW
jgi:CubicO group peptidase (beta-lactamase class C family)